MKLVLLFFGYAMIPCSMPSPGKDRIIYWAFGHNVGLDFNQNPLVIFQTELQCWKGGSVFFSDPAGNPLFYSTVMKQWDATNSIMPNGSGLTGNGPASPGFPLLLQRKRTVAAQTVINPDQYYLFTTGCCRGCAAFMCLGKVKIPL